MLLELESFEIAVFHYVHSFPTFCRRGSEMFHSVVLVRARNKTQSFTLTNVRLNLILIYWENKVPSGQWLNQQVSISSFPWFSKWLNEELHINPILQMGILGISLWHLYFKRPLILLIFVPQFLDTPRECAHGCQKCTCQRASFENTENTWRIR